MDAADGTPDAQGSSAQDARDWTPEHLRPFTFHGVHLELQGGQGVGDCPFCGKEGKLSVHAETGLWRCWSCGGGTDNGGGNSLTFMRLLYGQWSSKTNENELPFGSGYLEKIADDRRLLSRDTVRSWGVCIDPLGTWIVPGYDTEGKLTQLYRRTRIQERGEWVWRLLPTPGVWAAGKVHALHMPVGDWEPLRPNILICEGPWDGMAVWETWPRPRPLENVQGNIVAVPGCNVWRAEWTKMCAGKHVTLMFDSDHPRENNARAGYDGMARVAKRLSGVAASVRYLKWGENGFDPTKPSGYDVRDFLTEDQ